ncbi:RNB family domain containing protein [Entamoeba marina]
MHSPPNDRFKTDLNNFFFNQRLLSSLGTLFIRNKCPVEFSDGSLVDLTQRQTFTIDTIKAKLKDDGFHICITKDGSYEIGFHTPFLQIQSNSSFKKLLTSSMAGVYSELEYCNFMKNVTNFAKDNSLDCGETRKCLSLLIKVSPDGYVQRKWYGVTKIKVHANVFYSNGQKIRQLAQSLSDRNVNVVSGTTLDEVSYWISQMDEILVRVDEKGIFQEKMSYDHSCSSCVENFGYLIAESNGPILKKLYGNCAFCKTEYKNQICFTTNRSPLRKFADNLANLQLYCIMKKMDVSEMVNYIAGFQTSLEQFQDLIIYLCLDTSSV